MLSWDVVSQIGIIILGAISVILIAEKNKWGFVFGLLTQPFWFTTSLVNHQWGVFVASLIYTVVWIYGIYKWFFHNKIKK